MESIEVIKSTKSKKSLYCCLAALFVISALTVVLIIFIGFYAGQVSQGSNSATGTTGKNHTGTSSSTSSGTSSGTTSGTSTVKPVNTTVAPPKQKELCETTECINLASQMLKSMDASVDPCEDFYQYSCGSWPKHYPLNPSMHRNSVLHEMRHEIAQILEVLVDETPGQYREVSVQKKIKQFFTTCKSSYWRRLNSGKILLEKIINPTGEWFLLQSNWNESNWSLTRALAKTYADFGTPAVFTVTLKPAKNGKMAIHINVRDTGRHRWFHTNVQSKTEYYKVYIATVVKQIIEDNNITIARNTLESRLKIFIEDVFVIETFIAYNIAWISVHGANSTTVTLAKLDELMKHIMNFTQIIQYKYPGAGITSETLIVVENTLKFNLMVAFMQGLKLNQTIYREFNNYVIWRLIEAYIPDLSSPFIHARHELYYRLMVWGVSTDMHEYCMTATKTELSKALSHLFIKNYFIKENKKKAELVTRYMKKGATAMVFNIPSLQSHSKDIIKETINNLTYNHGYPDWMEDSDAVNNYYLNVSINDNHLDNVLSFKKFHKVSDVEILIKGSKETDWKILSPEIHNTKDSVYVPAVLIQTPLYNHRAPSFANFGEFGGIIAESILSQIINTIGQDPSRRFVALINCIRKTRLNIAEGPFLIKGVQKYAYLALEREHGVEKGLPGLKSLSNHQLFFLSFAQLQCSTVSDLQGYKEASYYVVPDKWIFNQAMWNIQDFSDVFKCKRGSTMNPTLKCPV